MGYQINHRNLQGFLNTVFTRIRPNFTESFEISRMVGITIAIDSARGAGLGAGSGFLDGSGIADSSSTVLGANLGAETTASG
jgi:hypothetical protein